ncbi:MAG TPA: phosphatase PAP2 family protein [Solirubrobacteraceae bacterium]
MRRPAVATASTEDEGVLPLHAPAPPRRLPPRALTVGVPVVYVVALAVVVDRWGLPVARDQLFLWLALGMAAFSVAAWRSWGVMLLEWLPFFGLLVVYDFLRGAVGVAPEQAHVAAQVAVDKALAGGAIPTVWLQDHLWSPGHPHWYDYGVWAVYMTHFFVVWITAAVLWRLSRPRFRRYAALTVALTLGAFVGYWVYPAQPPWLTAAAADIPPVDRIVPEVWGHLGVPTVQSVYENGHLVNTVAAMPSLHAAYPFMLLLFFWSAGRWVRIGLALYTVAMAFALVYGGEHYVTDILAGWALAGALYAAGWTVVRHAHRALPTGREHVSIGHHGQARRSR